MFGEEFKKKYAGEIKKHIDEGKTPDDALNTVLESKKAQKQGLSKVPGAKKSFYDLLK